MKRHLAILITSGPENKSFVYSGLLKSLAEHFQISIFTRYPDSLSIQYPLAGVNIFPLPETTEPRQLQIWRYRSAHVHSLSLKKGGVEKWRHYLNDSQPDRPDGLRQIFLDKLASPVGVSLFSYIEKKISEKQGINPVWQGIFDEHKINGLITSSYSNPLSITALQTAKNLGLCTWVITNSWKDIFVNPHLPFQLTDFFLWRQDEVDFLQKANPAFPGDRIHAVGSLHLAPFISLQDLMPREEFFTAIGLDSLRPLINYTTASPKAVKNEDRIVAALIECLKDPSLPVKPQLIIRTNPMETEPRFDRFISEDVHIQKPDWEWIPEKAWNCPSREDLRWWVNTVFYSNLNVSIASSVTLEFDCLGKPVINICFDLPEALSPSESNRRFWDAPFYDEVRQKGMAIPVYNFEELQQTINNLLISKTKFESKAYPNWIKQNPITEIDRIISARDSL